MVLDLVHHFLCEIYLAMMGQQFRQMLLCKAQHIAVFTEVYRLLVQNQVEERLQELILCVRYCIYVFWFSLENKFFLFFILLKVWLREIRLVKLLHQEQLEPFRLAQIMQLLAPAHLRRGLQCKSIYIIDVGQLYPTILYIFSEAAILSVRTL